jgi:hypothetical protein
MNKKISELKMKVVVITIFICCFSVLLSAQEITKENNNEANGHIQAHNKGDLYLHLSLPVINLFKTVPKYGNFGFGGFTVGFDYYYSKNKFIHYASSVIPNISPKNFSKKEEYNVMVSAYGRFTNNHIFGRFTIGYGLSFGINDYFSISSPIKDEYFIFGLIFPTHFQVGKNFNIGVVYRPTFYRPNAVEKFAYEHLLSIDCAWKIRLRK